MLLLAYLSIFENKILYKSVSLISHISQAPARYAHPKSFQLKKIVCLCVKNKYSILHVWTYRI